MSRVRGIETRSTRCSALNYTDYAIKQEQNDYSKLLLVRSSSFYFWVSAYIAVDFCVAGTENSFPYFLYAVYTRRIRKFLHQNSARSLENKTTLKVTMLKP